MPKLNRCPARPTGMIDVILDTDAFNEIDDQFAVSYLLRAPEKCRIRAFCAAPFFNSHSENDVDGMEKSYQELHKILRLAGAEAYIPLVYRGAGFLKDEKTPNPSEAAKKIIEISREYTAEHPLYVVSIGAISNVASALLMEPAMAERVVIVWLGGHAQHWPMNDEFNLQGDIAAARIVFAGSAPLVQLPCMGVVDTLSTSAPELIHWLRGKNALCDYLCDNTIQEAESYAKGKPWTRVIWDISTIAWLLDEKCEMLQERKAPLSMPQYDLHHSISPDNDDICYVWHVNRDKVFEDLFRRLTAE